MNIKRIVSAIVLSAISLSLSAQTFRKYPVHPLVIQRAVFFGQNVTGSAPPPVGVLPTSRGCFSASASGTSISCTITGAVAGESFVCRSLFQPDTVTNVADDKSDSMLGLFHQGWNSGGSDFFEWYSQNIVGGDTTVTITLDIQSPFEIACNELSGASHTVALDPASPVFNNTCTGSPITGANITTGAANELLVTMYMAADGSAVFTSTTGDTAFPLFNEATFETAFYRVIPTAGTVHSAATQSGSTACMAFTVAFQP